jgi:hypothetical protein
MSPENAEVLHLVKVFLSLISYDLKHIHVSLYDTKLTQFDTIFI